MISLQEHGFGVFEIPIPEKQFMIAVLDVPPSFTLYVFKEFGIPSYDLKQLAEKVITKLREQHVDITDVKYICLVEDYAYSAVFNHNNDETDPSRGTGLYSLRWFFEKFFSLEDFEEFKNQAQKYKTETQKYFGLSVVKTLTPNALFNFKRTIRYTIRRFDFRKHVIGNISEEQYQIIMGQFMKQGFYKAMLAHNDFSESFLTSEWLFESLSMAGKIDYTSIAMGYFKAIEQLLYDYISFHKNEGRTIKRKNSSGYIEFNDINISQNNIDVSLGALNSFLNYYKNYDLFRAEVASDTINFVKQTLSNVRGLRNGYSHKDNLHDWEKVESARKNAFLVCFLILGAYKFSESEKVRFSIPSENDNNDFIKLCEYTNYHDKEVYYIFEGNEEPKAYLSSQDEFVHYNEYGDPTYSGVYFRRIKWAKNTKMVIPVSEMNSQKINPGIPADFDEQTLETKRISIGRMLPVQEGLLFTGPETLIYDCGKYCAPEDKEKPEF